MRRTRRALLGAVGILAFLTAAACGDDDDGDSAVTTAAQSTTAAQPGESTATTVAQPESSASTTAAPDTTTTAGTEPKAGGTLDYLTHLEATRGFDPTAISSVLAISEAPAATAIFDTLFYIDPETNELKGQIGESLTSDDATVWTLKLRPNVKFSDGTPYDAAAVKFNWERIADPANKSSQQSIAGAIASMEVVGDTELTVTLKQPTGQFPLLVASRIPFIGSPTAIQALGPEFANKPVGAGPFIVREYLRDNILRLERNPSYWDAPRPYLDGLTFRLVLDAQQRLNSIKAGDAQAMHSASSAQVYTQAQSDGLPTIETTNPIGGTHYMFNLAKPPFDDIRARQAVTSALNMPEMYKTLFGEDAAALTHMVREPSPFYEADLELPTYDPAKAQALIDEYAAEKGPLEFTISNSNLSMNIPEYFLGQLREFENLKVNAEPVAGTEFIPKLSSGSFQMMQFTFQGYDPEPELYDHYYTGSTRNFMKYSNPEMDAALDHGRASLDESDRKAAYRTVQELALRDLPEIWYTALGGAAPFGGFILAPEVKDFIPTNGSPLWSKVWLD